MVVCCLTPSQGCLFSSVYWITADIFLNKYFVRKVVFVFKRLNMRLKLMSCEQGMEGEGNQGICYNIWLLKAAAGCYVSPLCWHAQCGSSIYVFMYFQICFRGWQGERLRRSMKLYLKVWRVFTKRSSYRWRQNTIFMLFTHQSWTIKIFPRSKYQFKSVYKVQDRCPDQWWCWLGSTARGRPLSYDIYWGR